MLVLLLEAMAFAQDWISRLHRLKTNWKDLRIVLVNLAGIFLKNLRCLLIWNESGRRPHWTVSGVVKALSRS
jgi:hypothetical protein